MKIPSLLILIITTGLVNLCLSEVSHAQLPNEVGGVSVALNEGSSKALAKYFDEMVEISLNNNKKDFSKSQAEMVLRDFFKTYPASGFETVQEGRTSENLLYIIGIYYAKDDKFRVLIRGKIDDEGQLMVYRMDFIKE
jgi:hypothetical protein